MEALRRRARTSSFSLSFGAIYSGITFDDLETAGQSAREREEIDEMHRTSTRFTVTNTNSASTQSESITAGGSALNKTSPHT